MSKDKMIPISKEGGLEPHLITCIFCGGDVNGLTVGVLYEATLNNGQKTYYNRDELQKLKHDLKKHGLEVVSTRHVEENEKVPAGICDTCQAKIDKEEADMRAMVEAGGVYFQCAQCGIKGAMPASDFTAEIRKRNNKPAPEPIGIMFDNCTQHGKLK